MTRPRADSYLSQRVSGPIDCGGRVVGLIGLANVLRLALNFRGRHRFLSNRRFESVVRCVEPYSECLGWRDSSIDAHLFSSQRKPDAINRRTLEKAKKDVRFLDLLSKASIAVNAYSGCRNGGLTAEARNISQDGILEEAAICHGTESGPRIHVPTLAQQILGRQRQAKRTEPPGFGGFLPLEPTTLSREVTGRGTSP